MEILFVDDELERIEVFIQDIEIEVLEKGMKMPTTKGISNLEIASDHITKNIDSIKVVILDIMMPGGDRFYRQNEDPLGLRCGFYFYQLIRGKFSDLEIIIFTNVGDMEIALTIDKDPCARLLLKDEILPFELTDIVLGLIVE
jgi:CheY-like chemotaxis protein